MTTPRTSSLDDIKADEIVTMTKTWALLFKHGGCDPTCHGCDKPLEVGTKFKLATMEKSGDETREVMLCSTCTPEKARKNEGRRLAMQRARNLASGGSGCFRINGKIVP